MKKFTVLLMIITFLLCSCQANEKVNTNSKENTSSQKKTQTEDLSSSKENETELIIPKTPLSNELNQLFEQGLEVYRWFNISIMGDGQGKPVIKGELTYYPVNNERFPTYESWYQYINSVFSKEMIDHYLSKNYYINIKGQLYGVMADRGGNIFYKSHKYELVSQTENKVELKIIGIYNEGTGEEDYYKEYTTIFEKQNGKWIITQFEFWL
ncbi:DL-endopeptidase inhibitor IseA family protein [Paludicola sp. MB14-C6]|uniref:DL-endopeptidase inhibitor IseA family protein n=1 Tax=Paludihabitans sp. MB14-C6 TaxID=3070656 RepID=UPI0027DB0EEB|nr:DL-endopeptidase inhibitor IseA family protein [Paludicola sp. MB14-C6]WMJ21802.1 DL-endopeptidase inhibitor IseA family protein [Paludicola sp. MB14-C6]